METVDQGSHGIAIFGDTQAQLDMELPCETQLALKTALFEVWTPDCSHSSVKGGCSQVRAGLSSQERSDRMRGHGLKLCQQSVRMDIRRKFLM